MLDKLIVLIIGLQVFFRSSFVNVNLLPTLSIGPSSLGLHDLSFFVLCVSVFIKIFLEKKNSCNWDFHNKLFATFLIIGVFGIFNAVFTDTSFHLAAKEARNFFLYILYFAVISLSLDEKRILQIVKAILWISIVTSIFSVLQIVLGDRIGFLFGKISVLRTQGDEIEGVTRVGSGGLGTINLMFFICLSSLLYKFNQKQLIILLILSMAIFLSFNRGTWLSIILSIIFIFPVIQAKLRIKIIKTSIILSVLGSIFLGLGMNGFLGSKLNLYSGAVIERFVSVLPGQVENDGSTMDRFDEAEIVLQKIAKRPLFGYGLGAITQENMVIQGEVDRERMENWGYVHNGYLYMIFKLGLLGMIVFLLFYITFIMRALKNLKKIHDEKLHAIYLGSLLFIISILPHSIVSPRIMEGKYITVIAIALGLIEIIKILSINSSESKIEVENDPDVNSSVSDSKYTRPRLRG